MLHGPPPATATTAVCPTSLTHLGYRGVCFSVAKEVAALGGAESCCPPDLVPEVTLLAADQAPRGGSIAPCTSVFQLHMHSERHFRDFRHFRYLRCLLTLSRYSQGTRNPLACAGLRSDISFKNKTNSTPERS